MAERVLLYVATIPAGTSQSAPHTVPFDLDNWSIERIDLEVPAGPSGCMGFYLANNGRPWVPRNPNAWLVWDDHSESIVPTGYPSASGWGVTGYNVGQYDHAVNVRFHVSPLQAAAAGQDFPVLTFVETVGEPTGEVVL